MNGLDRILQHNLTIDPPDYVSLISGQAGFLQEIDEAFFCPYVVGEGGAVRRVIVELIEGLLEEVWERPYREGGC